MNMFLFDSITLNISLTVIISLVVIAIFVIEHIFVKKREENLKRWFVITTTLATFVILLAAVVGLLLIWNVDLLTLLTGFWQSIIDFVTQSVPALIGTVVAFFVWMLILRIAKITLKRIGSRPGAMQKRRQTITKVSYSIINYTLAIIGIIVILAIWGVNVLPALAGLGIVGLVVGLGAQKFIQDLIAGFFIIFEHHFDVGDVIEVSGFKGTVTDIGLKTTKIRNWKGDVRIYNNGEVNTLINYSRNPSIAIVEFGIAYQEDIDKTIDILNANLPKFKGQFPEVLLEDPAVAGVIGLGASSVDLRVTVKTMNEQHYGVERALRKFIKNLLDQHHIEIPFPQVVVNQPTPRD